MTRAAWVREWRRIRGSWDGEIASVDRWAIEARERARRLALVREGRIGAGVAALWMRAALVRVRACGGAS